MARTGLADALLPQHLKNEIERHLHHKGLRTNNDTRNVSRETLARRRSILMRVFAELYELNYKIQSANSLRETHVRALVAHWVETGKQPATIQNNLSVLRMFAAWINKKGMVKSSMSYVDDPQKVKRSVVAKENRSWAAKGIDPLVVIEQAKKLDEHVALYLQLMFAFGLRLKEALCLKPIRDVVMDEQWLSARDGTKGGRQRMIPIETTFQRETIKLAQAMADQKSGTIIPRNLSLAKAYSRAKNQLRKLGLTKTELGVTAHGLRHMYAQTSYQQITGRPTPIQGGNPAAIERNEHQKACFEVMERLGHSRVDVGGSYYGSFGHALRRSSKSEHPDSQNGSAVQNEQKERGISWTHIPIQTLGSLPLTATEKNGEHIAKPSISYAATFVSKSSMVGKLPSNILRTG